MTSKCVKKKEATNHACSSITSLLNKHIQKTHLKSLLGPDFLHRFKFLSSVQDYLWHELTKTTSSQPEEAQGVASTSTSNKKIKKFKAGFSCLLCVGVFTLQSGSKMRRRRERGEREEDANKPEPGVFVSERVSADVNSVPL